MSHWQNREEVLDVASWIPDEEYGIYPEGSRVKSLIRCPIVGQPSWLIPEHRYLFKQSRGVYPHQFWMEIAAYRIGLLTGTPVPPAYAAWNSTTNESAALIEWFYGRPDQNSLRFVPGGNLMKAAIKDFDHKSGRQHNFGTLANFLGIFARKGWLSDDWIEQFAKMLAFDALIGNTDRHQENWGLLIRQTPSDSDQVMSLAPAFDNGTSFGHEIQQDKFGTFRDNNKRDRYIERGTHHLKWRISDVKKRTHLDLLADILKLAPKTAENIGEICSIDLDAARDAILKLTTFDHPQPLSVERAEFMLTLLAARKQRIAAVLEP